METEQQRIRNEINARNQQISAGVSVQDKERMQREIVAYEEQLKNLEQPQELPPEEEVKTEPILATVDGLPLEVYTRNEDAAILIRCEVESIVERLNKAHVVTVGGLNNKLHIAVELELMLKQRNVDLDKEFQLCAEELQKLSHEYSELESNNQQLTLERDQALLYRDNAAKQLEDMAFELEQARIELNRNREVRALTEAERTAEQEAARERFMDSRIKVYDVEWEDDIKRTHYIAKRAEDAKSIRYGRLEVGGHLEITRDEALAIQAMNAPVEIPEVTEEVTQELFQEEASTESTQDLDESEDQGEQRETLEVEPETFEERTERRLNAIEHRLNKNEPEYVYEAEVA